MAPENTSESVPATAGKTPPAPEARSGGLHLSDRFNHLREEMDRFASEMFGGNWLTRRPFSDMSDLVPGVGLAVPSVDVHENDTSITITAELPGMDEKDVDLTVKNGVLTLKGEKRYETTDEKDEARVIERRYGSFQRSFTLPDSADDEKAEAKFEKGVLTITMPKRPGTEMPERKIGITQA